MAFFKRFKQPINKLWYPKSVVVSKPVDTDEVADRLAQISTVSRADTIIVLLAVVMSAMMTGCKTVYVPVESARNEYRDKLMKDSIYLKDSIYIREKGDTVFSEQWHTNYIEKLLVDSFVKVDSIQVPYPVEKRVEVERSLNGWERIKMEVGGIAIGAVILILICFIWKIVREVKKVGWKAVMKLILGI